MKTMTLLLAESSLAMALFYFVYWFFLRKETCFAANRFYLLGALLLSVILPFFPLRYTVWVEQGQSTVFTALSEAIAQVSPVEGAAPSTNSGFPLFGLIMITYFTGAAFLLLRLFSQTLVLISVLLRSKRERPGNVPLVENNRYQMPFSFFRYIFINPAIHTGSDLSDIIAHEKVHIRGYHWIDLLVAEILTVVFWFNPIVWWFERSIKQNHEYLADEGVLAQGRSLGRYQALLINQLMGMQVIGITNHLNFGLNATRINMMTKKKNSKLRAVRMVWALPVIAALMVAFAQPVYQNVPPVNDEIAKNLDPEGSPGNLVKVSGVVSKSDGSHLQGAAVIVSGTTTGTITNEEGRFNLNIPDGNGSTIHISFVGLETVTYKVNSDQDLESLKITMNEGVFKIDPAKHFAEVPPPPPPPPPKMETKYTTVGKPKEEVFVVVERMPEYPGGFYGLGQYIQKKQKEHSFWEILKGTALIAFTVDEKGKVTRIKVAESDNEDIAKAAVQIAQGMADWKPGMQRGRPVPVNFTLPIEF